MNKLMKGALGALAMVAAGGCATTYRVTEVAPPPPPPVQAPVAAPIVVKVSARAADKAAARLATSLRGSVETRLAARGMTVASPLPPNANVSLEVSRRETARLDDWRAYEGTAHVRVSLAAPNERLLSETAVTAAGERALDEVKAEQGVDAGLARQVNAWLDRVVTAQTVPVVPAPPPVALPVARLNFAPVSPATDRREALDAQIAFRSAVAAVDGIVSCSVAVGTSGASGVSFDIVYDPAKFPDGLVNTLVARLRERGELERFKLLFRSKGIDLEL